MTPILLIINLMNIFQSNELNEIHLLTFTQLYLQYKIIALMVWEMAKIK